MGLNVRNARALGVALVLMSVLWIGVTVSGQPAASRGSSHPALQTDRCYRLTFSIAAAPNWKVLEVLDAGWVKAEIDAGPPTARREPAWINTAQIITVREARCSE
jgi:hypothetical protein